MTTDLRTPPLKYHRIADEMRRRLVDLPAGARLPSERELAEQFGCHVLTVRKSLASLVDEGRIERRLGSGTFVADAGEVDLTVAARQSIEPLAASGPTVATAVGVLALTETDRYGQQLIQALGRMSTSRGVDLRLSWLQSLDSASLDQAAMLRETGCSAVILPWFPHTQATAAARFVRSGVLPTILPMIIPGLERHCFEHPDCFGRSTLSNTDALVHLFHRLGHRRIALLGPATPADPILQAKLSAYACAVGALGLDNHCGLVGSTSAAMDQLAGRWRPADGDLAVISYDDTLAVRFMTAMHKLGLSAPTDFAIMGHNNIEAGRFSDPPLSTLCQDFDYIAGWMLRSAQALALGGVEQSKSPPPYRLVVRASCGSARRLDESFLCDMTSRGLSPTIDMDSLADLDIG